MQTNITTDGRVMTAYLSGELDHHNAPAVREKIDAFAVGFCPAHAILDFGGVTFMDSSGVGLVMGRSKLLAELSCTLEVRNLSPHAYKVMRLAKLDKLAALSRAPEQKEEKHHETLQ